MATPSLTPDLAGTYVIQLVVSDGFAESAADMVVVNEISRPDSGFSSDYNEVRIYQNPKKGISIPRATKDEIAKAVVDHFMYGHSKRKKNV